MGPLKSGSTVYTPEADAGTLVLIARQEGCTVQSMSLSAVHAVGQQPSPACSQTVTGVPPAQVPLVHTSPSVQALRVVTGLAVHHSLHRAHPGGGIAHSQVATLGQVVAIYRHAALTGTGATDAIDGAKVVDIYTRSAVIAGDRFAHPGDRITDGVETIVGYWLEEAIVNRAGAEAILASLADHT